MIKKIVICAFGIIILLAAAAGFMWYQLTKLPAAPHSGWLYIQGQTISDPSLLDNDRIQTALKLMKFDERLQNGSMDGAYRIDSGMTPMQVSRKLTRRMQDPVKLTFHDIRLKEQWAGRVAERLMCDSAAILEAMLDPKFLEEAETDVQNVCGILLPDTYEVYWTITPQDLMQRMLKEYRRFWNESRQAKAESLGLTPQEVVTLGSIAEEETQNRSERGTVAMLYWNRLQMMMPLQADPTVKYALGNFGLKRILNVHLETESPYNTYKHEGLPPGPIRLVEKATIDTILNAKMHPYLYMCAKPDFSGRHNFATTYGQHLRNAEAYHAALNRLK